MKTSTIARRVALLCGNGDFGRLGTSDNISRNVFSSHAPLSEIRVKTIACGGAHTLILDDEGVVHSVGLNDRGQLGISSMPSTSAPIAIPGLPRVKAIAAGHYHSSCITEEGSLFMWGSNKHGQLGLGPKAPFKIFQPEQVMADMGGQTVKEMALGASHSVSLTEDGSVWTWGSAANGNLGLGSRSIVQKWLGSNREVRPRQVEALKDHKIRSIAAGHQHTACVDAHGTLFTFGYGRFWQLGLGTEANAEVPGRVPGINSVSQAACGGAHSAAVTADGALHVWGANEAGCLGLGRDMSQYAREPVTVEGVLAQERVHQVACGWKHTACVTASGELFTWGWGGSQGSYSVELDSTGGQLGLGNEFDHAEPTKVEIPAHPETGTEPRVVQVSCGFNHTAAVVEYSH